MKALFIGGIKSGKSKNAENYTLKYAKEKPFYLATTEFIDAEIKEKIALHKKQREDSFITIEEPLNLADKISTCQDIVLVECVSMWINNMLYHKKSYTDIKTEIETLMSLKQDIVFVLNDVGGGVISQNALVRKFVDISGKISQLIASESDEVFHTIAGISTKIK
jgi:adenosylcobinamide kinase/adenosylcobinamide-phosphate guanylyltransferase